MLNAISKFYDDLWERRDKRLDNWPLMSSAWPTVNLTLAYVLLVTLVGPALMRWRKEPFSLKTPIMVYNVLQVAGSSYVVYEAAIAGWATHYSWVCQDVERSTDPNGTGMRMARIGWVSFISKFFEFFDTFFFIARKKFEHVSALQVIHHSIMPLYGFMLCRWLPGGQESFGGFINSIVHVIMYFYYFMAALGPQFQKYLWWKKYLTTFQMVQFVVIFIKSLIVIFGVSNCGYPWQFSAISASLMVLFFGLFLNFYMRAYKRKPRIIQEAVKKD